MDKQKIYPDIDSPTGQEKEKMWSAIQSHLSPIINPENSFHWRSFWIGNAAALLLLFAGIGIYSTTKYMLSDTRQSTERMYTALSTATDQLKEITPILIEQAESQNKSSIKSTAEAIAEIDQLIEELKTDMLLHGATPSKQSNLKQLYATKLDFYRDLLLNEEIKS